MKWVAVLIATLAVGSDETFDCGARALYTALLVKGSGCDLSSVTKMIGKVSESTDSDTLATLNDAARRFGLHPLMVYFSDKQVGQLPAGTIVHTIRESKGHFVVYLGETDKGVVLADAPIPPMVVARRAFQNEWSGYALLLFESADEASRFQTHIEARRRWFWCGLAVLSVGAIAVYGCFRARATRKRLKVLRFCVLLLFLGCFGCEQPPAKPSHKNFPCDVLPSVKIDAGFVAPGGRDVKITLINRTGEEVEIGDKNIKTSCGCTRVTAPNIIPPRGSAALLVRLEGQHEPFTRTSKILVGTKSGEYTEILLHYSSGDLPCMTPHFVEVTKSSLHEWSSDATVWFNAPSTGIMRFQSPKDSPLAIEVLDGVGYSRKSADSVEIVNTGMVGVQVHLVGTQNKIHGRGIGRFTIGAVDKQHRIDYEFAFRDESLLKVFPGRATFLGEDVATSRIRVVIVKSSFPGECEVVHCPAFVSAALKRLSEDTWKLELWLCSENVIPGSEEDIRISCHSKSGQVAEGICRVGVMAKLFERTIQ